MERVFLDGGGARMLDYVTRDYPLDHKVSAIVGGRPIASARKDNVPAGGDEEAIRNARDPGEPAGGHDHAARREPEQNECPSCMDTDRTRHRTRNTQFMVNVEVTVVAESHWQAITFGIDGAPPMGDRSVTIRHPRLSTITPDG